MSEWLTIRVQLIGRRGVRLPDAPGRVLLAHDEHTFGELAQAIDIAFGRYDLDPEHVFDVEGHTLASAPADVMGTVGDELEVEASDEVTLGEVGLRLGSPFTYTFDPELVWLHECLVDAVGVDPFELAGEEPEIPIPLDGWGAIPDQFGRAHEHEDAVAVPAGIEDEEYVDEAELTEWDAQERVCLTVLDDVLGPDGGAAPQEELAGAVQRLAEVADGGDWTLDVLWAAAGMEPGDESDPTALWLNLAAGVVSPHAPVPLEPDEEAAWAALEPRDWTAAVLELVRGGIGQPADAETIVELIVDSEDIHNEDLTDEDEDVLVEGFSTVVQLWVALGALDDKLALTDLGRWGLPEALRLAWSHVDDLEGSADS